MHIQKLKIINFRNHKERDLEFSRGFNILYGNNAQGKTNILEAIFLCATGRSHRTSHDREMLMDGEESFYIKLDFLKDGEECVTEIGFMKNEKKRIKLNGIKTAKIGSMIGHFNAVMFSPEDLSVIKDGPSERRRFLDISISQTKPSYFFDLQRYGKLIEQRNTLLRDAREKGVIPGVQMEVWDEAITKTGARIINARDMFIRRLGEMACNKHRKLTNDDEVLELKYVPAVKMPSYENTDDIEDTFSKLMTENIRRDIAAGVTLNGPHRDDYEIYINGSNIRIFGSQGQQRTAVLSIKLAEIGMMRELNGSNPVLLLDDVMSELDSRRQAFLYNSLEEVQTFITCTDTSFFSEKKPVIESKYFCISNEMKLQ